jgi:hypothetical protein
MRGELKRRGAGCTQAPRPGDPPKQPPRGGGGRLVRRAIAASTVLLPGLGTTRQPHADDRAQPCTCSHGVRQPTPSSSVEVGGHRVARGFRVSAQMPRAKSLSLNRLPRIALPLPPVTALAPYPPPPPPHPAEQLVLISGRPSMIGSMLLSLPRPPYTHTAQMQKRRQSRLHHPPSRAARQRAPPTNIHFQPCPLHAAPRRRCLRALGPPRAYHACREDVSASLLSSAHMSASCPDTQLVNRLEFCKPPCPAHAHAP